MRAQEVIDTLNILGVLDSDSREDKIKVLDDFKLDFMKVYRLLRKNLKDDRIEENELNKISWECTIEMCRLYENHTIKEMNFYEFINKLCKMYYYSNGSNKKNGLVAYIKYINMSNPFDLRWNELKVILILHNSNITLEINGKKHKLKCCDSYVDRYVIPNLQNETIGYGITKDGIKYYEITKEGLREFLYDLIRYADNFERFYRPFLSTIGGNYYDIVDIDDLTNKEYLYLLRLLFILNISKEVDTKKFKKLEDSKLRIYWLLNELYRLGNIKTENIINIVSDVLDEVKAESEIKEIAYQISMKYEDMAIHSNLDIASYNELKRYINRC